MRAAAMTRARVARALAAPGAVVVGHVCSVEEVARLFDTVYCIYSFQFTVLKVHHAHDSFARRPLRRRRAPIHATLGGSSPTSPRSSTPMPSTARRSPNRPPPEASAPRRSTRPASGSGPPSAISRGPTECMVVDGDLVVTYGTLSGRQTGDFVVWTPDGTVERAFAPTGKTFTVRQAHFQRIVDGLVIEHWAVRDDQGMAVQLGWIPPSPGFLLRCYRATKRARRAARAATTQRLDQP